MNKENEFVHNFFKKMVDRRGKRNYTRFMLV